MHWERGEKKIKFSAPSAWNNHYNVSKLKESFLTQDRVIGSQLFFFLAILTRVGLTTT